MTSAGADGVTKGSYSVQGDIISFVYEGWNTAALPVSRFALVIRKRPDELSIAVQGHTHGIEVLERMSPL